jgi:hypothetical protein
MRRTFLHGRSCLAASLESKNVSLVSLIEKGPVGNDLAWGAVPNRPKNRSGADARVTKGSAKHIQSLPYGRFGRVPHHRMLRKMFRIKDLRLIADFVKKNTN